MSRTAQPQAPSTEGRWHRRARHALAHSLRVRMVALFFVLALAMAATFVFGMQAALSIGWRDAARPLVTDYVDKLAADLGSPPRVEAAQALVARLPLSVRISGPQVNWRSHPKEPDYDAHWRTDEGWKQDEPRFFERTTADGHTIRFGLNVQAWHDRPRFIGWITLGVLLVLIALAYLKIRRMLRPLDDIRDGAQRFGRGDFAQAIPVRHFHRQDELGQLATTINTMGADIHQMLEAKRALLLAISHELRSPLTRARLNTELLPETPELQASREALLRDLGVMRDLVTDLLESERLASPHVALQREPTALASVVSEVVAGLDGNPLVHTQVDAHIPLLALDRTRMRLLLRNLLENALRHTPTDAPVPEVHVHLQTDGSVHITVRDHGPGVPEDQLPQLAQPFYRPDAARTREGGGVGLGLYLCKLVATAHGGTFAVRNASPGLEVSVTLPAA
ncbi:HAMP domain-containing sensor histidine kinase [Rhodoferax aquaticus]|uniref:histidine kinase n=1 Tax=Rhodoferax aquaticus TaxID=2527691 RepID=A0A515ETV1_9BURK|nr:HAMP domain-containing sensor histidine kinase [Rhodoferax aquaticus]QDL56003.1 HAMP domain-containing histidine kinase [Rhodoferax aquaticus]